MVRAVRNRLVAIALVVLASVGVGAASGPTEYELKAIFLYNFTKYVEWPDETRNDLVICVLGVDPFGEALEDVVADERVGKRGLAIRRISGPAQSDGCHLVFVSRSEELRQIAVLEALAPRGVLTVGETDGFARDGGIIGLREENNRIRITINTAAAERAGLRISSQLLKLGDVFAGDAR